MKKNNIKILFLVIVLTLTMVGCKPANNNMRNLSTQTRLRNNDMDNNMDNNWMGTDRPLNKRDGVNNSNNINNKLNNGMMRNSDNKLNKDTNLSTNMTNMSSRATAIAERIIALPEINNASVLISGDTAIVGCDINGETNNKITNALKQKVEAAVKVADRNIQKISVTSDPSIFTRIQTMTKDMNKNDTMDGNPATKFTKEIENILQDITNIK